MNFIFGFLCGIAASGVLIAIAAKQKYIQIGKGERADKVDDDLKAARDRFKETP